MAVARSTIKRSFLTTAQAIIKKGNESAGKLISKFFLALLWHNRRECRAVSRVSHFLAV